MTAQYQQKQFLRLRAVVPLPLSSRSTSIKPQRLAIFALAALSRSIGFHRM